MYFPDHLTIKASRLKLYSMVWAPVGSTSSHSAKPHPTGMQVIIFCICAYFLLQKKSRAGAIILLAVSVMLVLATVDVAMTFRVMLRDLQAVLRLEMNSDYLLAHLAMKNTFFVTDKHVYFI